MKKNKLVIGILSLFIFLLSACAKTGSFTSISPQDTLELLKKDTGAILIDVRTPEEHQALRIPGSVLVPDYEINEKIEEIVPDKNTTVIIYCRSGNRSAKAAKSLVEMGYTKVFDLGGIINWPYETEGEG